MAPSPEAKPDLCGTTLVLAVLAFLAFKTSDCEIFVLRDRLCVSEHGPDLARFEG